MTEKRQRNRIAITIAPSHGGFVFAELIPHQVGYRRGIYPCAFLDVGPRGRYSPQEDTIMELNELLYLDLETLNAAQAGQVATDTIAALVARTEKVYRCEASTILEYLYTFAIN